MKQLATYLSLTLAILFLSAPQVEAQWTQGSVAETIFCITTAPNGIGGTYGGGVFLPKNNGNSWQPFSNGLGTTYSVYELTAFGTKLFAATNFGVYLSKSGGTWKLRNTGLPVFTYAQAFVNEYIPVQISLHQNFLNPFNPTTTITYSLPEEGLVQLCVLDSYGRVVSQLENRIMPHHLGSSSLVVYIQFSSTYT